MTKYIGKALFCGAIAMLAGTSAFAATEPRVSRTDSSVAYAEIFGGGPGMDAECTADCGDGTGWICTGESVSCTDGPDGGCTATGGGKIATGSCSVN